MQATDSVGNTAFGSTSATFDFTAPAISGTASIQYVPAPNVFTTGTPAACLNRKNLLFNVTAATTCTDIRASFTVTEQLGGNPSVTAAGGAISFAASTAAGTSYVYDGTTTVAGTPADGAAYALTIVATDLVGNSATLTPAAPMFRLDTAAPASPNTAAAGPIQYTRVPWGSTATSGLPAFSVSGAAGAAEANGTIVIYDSPVTTADVIGQGPVAPDGSFGNVSLVRADRPIVWLAAADEAGNASPIVAAHNVTWTATFDGKVSGSTTANPNVLQADPSDTLVPGGSAIPQVGASWFGGRNPGIGVAPEIADYSELFSESASPLLSSFGGAGWVEPTATAPPALTSQTMSFDSARGVTVLYGGSTSTDVWEWDGTAWTDRPVAAGPGTRNYSTMVYDSVRAVTVLFGGSAAAGWTNDTWEWDGAKWTQRFPAAIPPGRILGGMAYDSARGVTVLAGGESGLGAYLNDTWEWNGTNWTQRTANGAAGSPPARSSHTMAYDTVRGVTILFGGQTSSSTRVNDTWEWNGAAWTQRTANGAATSPGARSTAAMDYDAWRGVTILFGGYGGSNLADVWEWNGTTWTLRTVSGAATPSGRSESAMAFDSVHGVSVLCGGSGSLNDTWTWNGASWVQASSLVLPPSRVANAMAYDSGRGVTVLFGGNGAAGVLNDTWEWSGGAWTLRSPAASPSAREAPALAYDAARAVTVAFGGIDGTSTVLNDTWVWNGTTWTQKTANGAAGSPAIRWGAVMAYDSSRSVTVLFGGDNGSGALNDTWEWNGSAWTQRTANGAASSPSSRLESAMVFDAARGVSLLFGGENGSGDNETWTWNGTAWSQKSPAVSPPARAGHVMAYIPSRGVTVLFGGAGAGGELNDTWEWNGTSWAQQFPITTPAGRSQGAMAYNAAGGDLIVEGGLYGIADTWLLSESLAAQVVDLLQLDFTATGESSSTASIQQISLMATAGGTGYTTSVPPATGTAVSGAAIAVWDGSEDGRWRVLATTTAGAGAPLVVTSSTSSAWQAANELSSGTTQLINLAVFPEVSEGTGAAQGAVALADPELTVRYQHAESGCTVNGPSTCLCAADEQQCGSICSDAASDAQNCGTCGHACAGGTWCIGSACVCPGTEVACNGVCTDKSTDPHNCGSCGTVCAPSQFCSASVCLGPTPVSLSSAFNRPGIVVDGTAFTGGLDAMGYGLSGNSLGPSRTLNGVRMFFGPSGGSSAVSSTGQSIALPAGLFSTLNVLAVGVNGSQASQSFSVAYTAGPPTVFAQSLSDWTVPQSYSNEVAAAAMAYRDTAAGGRDSSHTVYVYGYAFSIDNTRTVSTVTLPNNANVEVLALTLVP